MASASFQYMFDVFELNFMRVDYDGNGDFVDRVGFEWHRIFRFALRVL